MKVFLPFILPWIKKAHYSSAGGIHAHSFLIFAPIAGMAGESKIVDVVAAVVNAWDNMIDREAMIEQNFRSMTILATIAGSFSYKIIQAHR